MLYDDDARARVLLSRAVTRQTKRIVLTPYAAMSQDQPLSSPDHHVVGRMSVVHYILAALRRK